MRQCAWCNAIKTTLGWRKQQRKKLVILGRPVSHGICGKCAERWYQELREHEGDAAS
jgi:hypothetical protein